MIYSYLEVVNQGPYGTKIGFLDSEDSGSVHLGIIDDRKYVFIPDEVEILEQDEQIDFRLEDELSNEDKANLRNQRMVQLQKESLRTKLNAEVGDIHDLITDAFKLIEFNMMLTARLASDYLGSNPMDPETKVVYAARTQGMLDAIDSGQVAIRGSFEDSDAMLSRVMQKYSKLQVIVNEDYIQEMNRLGLNYHD